MVTIFLSMLAGAVVGFGSSWMIQEVDSSAKNSTTAIILTVVTIAEGVLYLFIPETEFGLIGIVASLIGVVIGGLTEYFGVRHQVHS